MWPKIIRFRAKPCAGAASTYSICFRPRKLDRTMRLMASHPVRPSTRMIEFSLRPKIVAMATARTMYGIDRKMSMMRISSESVRPPKNPAMAP